jgi:hypothetical protein
MSPEKALNTIQWLYFYMPHLFDEGREMNSEAAHQGMITNQKANIY